MAEIVSDSILDKGQKAPNLPEPNWNSIMDSTLKALEYDINWDDIELAIETAIGAQAPLGNCYDFTSSDDDSYQKSYQELGREDGLPVEKVYAYFLLSLTGDYDESWE